MATATNTATQQGIISTKLYLDSRKYSNQKYGEVLNMNNNTNYSISPNSVKLLPVVSNDGNYIKLFTETNMSINVGDHVFIMYDENMNRDLDDINLGTGRTVLDSYYEFSGCTDWIYLNQEQGYEVIKVNETNNEITIKRFYDSSLDNVKLYNHYLTKIYVHQMNFYGGWVDGVCFRKVNFNNSTDTYIDVDIKQCIVLSGTNAFYVDMRDKYDSQYVSVNSRIIDTITGTKLTFSPYKYKDFSSVSRTDSPVTSYFTYNNNSFGYTYINFTKFYNSIINNGFYTNCIFSGGTIYGGGFDRCDFYDVEVQSGDFTNCNINANSIWHYGIWYGSGSTYFGPGTPTNPWYNGIWNEGIFSGKTWVTGIFNSGMFEDSVWLGGTFNGGGSIFNPNGDENFKNSYWTGGTFNYGGMSNCIWSGGTFNGGFIENSQWLNGIFNNGIFQNSYWSGGTFNNGTMNSSYWYNGKFNNGKFNSSYWYNGIFNSGTFTSGGVNTSSFFVSSATTYKWMDGTFNGGEFKNSFWVKGDFKSGKFIKSMWSGGTFYYGDFNDSTWLYGDWLNGIVNNSVFHNVNWTQGTFNSGHMGKQFLISNLTKYDVPIVFWSGGTFNNGIFGNPNCVKWQTGLPGSYINNEIPSLYATYPSIINWYGGDFYGGKFYVNYKATGVNKSTLSTPSGGWYDGVFHEGYFYGIYLGGHWVNGLFHDRSYNWTDQIIPYSVKLNYAVRNDNIHLSY